MRTSRSGGPQWNGAPRDRAVANERGTYAELSRRVGGVQLRDRMSAVRSCHAELQPQGTFEGDERVALRSRRIRVDRDLFSGTVRTRSHGDPHVGTAPV